LRPAALLMLSGLVFAGCSAVRGLVCPAREQALPPPSAACVLAPPPTSEPLFLAGPDEGCPPNFAGCLDVDAGLALERNLNHDRRWIDEAWLRCGPTGETRLGRDGGG
jgi:hypothetical protein